MENIRPILFTFCMFVLSCNCVPEKSLLKNPNIPDQAVLLSDLAIEEQTLEEYPWVLN